MLRRILYVIAVIFLLYGTCHAEWAHCPTCDCEYKKGEDEAHHGKGKWCETNKAIHCDSNSTPFVDIDPIKYDPKQYWIISNELITRLNLKPDDRLNSNACSTIVVEGEDGNTYEWAYILKKHMDWIENKTNRAIPQPKDCKR